MSEQVTNQHEAHPSAPAMSATPAPASYQNHYQSQDRDSTPGPIPASGQVGTPGPASAPSLSTPTGTFDSLSNSTDRPNKRQKVAIACDVCRAKKVKCDSVRPICGPCSKRQHGAPCEYTTVTRTSHGPSKGYVHHLELKLKELQKETGRDVGMDDYLGRKRESLLSRTPPPETTSHLRQSSSSYGQPPANNWGTPIQWQQQQRPADDHPRQSFSAGPPSAQPINDAPVNGSTTPDGHRHEAERVMNGSYVHHKEPSMEERKDVLARSPAIDSPTVPVPQRKRQRSVDYILPSRKTADNLVEAYWETAYQLFPILDYEAFHRSYQSIWSGSPDNEQQIMCTLNLVFALASSFTDSMDADSRAPSAKTFFNRAQELFEVELWNANGQTLESIQCLLLICQYLQSQPSARQTWVFIGLAISMADSLFLHLASHVVLNERQKVIHQVVWHGCLYMKRILAMHSKRPSMIDELTATMIQRPFQRHMHTLSNEQIYFTCSLQLSEILDEILLQNHKTRTYPEGHPEAAHEYTLAAVTRLDAKLFRWRSDLPPPMVQVSYRETPALPHHRQANSIRLQYYNARILLFRPTLINWCRIQVDPRDPIYSESFQAQTSQNCATLCLHSSLDMIEFIFTRLPPMDGASPHPPPSTNGDLQAHSNSALPAWWEILSYLHTAALILLAARLNRPLCLSVPGSTLEDAFNTALLCVRHFARTGSELAEKSVRSLENLAYKTERGRCDTEIALGNAAAQAAAVAQAAQAQAQGQAPPPPPPAPQSAIRVADLAPEVRALDWADHSLYEL